ncbi:MAG TPA: NADH-quinone oxidoreductase subunit N [Nitrospiria bacterium]|nr:NADH-quinone oxidoreductase subunit N [Nitrospiria bacterium]
MEFTLTFSWADFLLILPDTLMTLLICLVLFLDFLFPKISKNTLGYISVLGMMILMGILGGYFAADIQGTLFKEMFALDSFAIFFKLFVLLSSILIILSSADYLYKVRWFKGEYYFLVLFSALGMMLMASANDLLSMFITLEFSAFGFYILVTYHREESLVSSEAGLKLFILSVFTAAIMAFGISLIYGETGTIIFPELAQMQVQATPGLILGFLFILIGLGFKIGAVPFHSWIPDIYQGAPTPVTSFLSIAPKGAAFAILLRFFYSTFGDYKGDWVWLLVAISVLSMTYGNIVAIAQKDIKRLLAYSGIAQIGNILIGMAAATKLGGESVLYYLLTYLFANIGAFAVVIAFSNRTGSDQIEDYSGLNRRSPFLAFALFIFLLSLAGVPPLAGFLGKIYVFTAAVKEGLVALLIIGLINIVIAMYYYLVVVKKLYIAEPTDRSPISTPWALQAVIYISLAGVLVLGIYPKPVIEFTVASAGIFSNMMTVMIK